MSTACFRFPCIRAVTRSVASTSRPRSHASPRGALALPVAPRLAVRRSDTRPQVGLAPADRHANLQGAFTAGQGPVRGRRIVIVDDVITTGSTVAELARALKQAGAATVDVWCVARATLDS